MEKISLKDILWNLKIDSLTLMQQNSIDIYRKGRDMVLLAPTGSGKTLAYLIPLVLSLTDEPLVQALVLVPSRELAQQIEQVFKSMSTGFVAMSCYGGRPAMDEHRLMKSIHPQVIIATPGRMNDHLNKGNVDVSALKTLVIDEFDKCQKRWARLYQGCLNWNVGFFCLLLTPLIYRFSCQQRIF